MPGVDDRCFVSFDKAVAILPEGDEIHTFRQAGHVLLGASWPRQDILDLMREFPVEETGETATRMGHALAVEDKPGRWLFIASKATEATPCLTT